MNKNGLTITVIFEAESANYGEGIGNISQLKKFTRADGKIYSYISRPVSYTHLRAPRDTR